MIPPWSTLFMCCRSISSDWLAASVNPLPKIPSFSPSLNPLSPRSIALSLALFARSSVEQSGGALAIKDEMQRECMSGSVTGNKEESRLWFNVAASAFGPPIAHKL